MSSKIIAIDIETACNVEGCVDFGKSICRNDHSLSPWHGRITTIAAYANGAGFVWQGDDAIASLDSYLNDFHLPWANWGVVGANFKFDWLWLAVHGLEIPMDRWVGDSQLAAFVLAEKIPDSWLAEYEEKRKLAGSHHRKAGKHSLKTLAPYFLGVEPFWETEDHDNAEYALKDAEYTARLVVELERRLKERGEYDFYKERLLPWTKMLVQAELRGIEIDQDAMNALETEMYAKRDQLYSKLEQLWKPAHQAYRSELKAALWAKYEAMAAKAGAPFNYGSRYWRLYDSARDKLPATVDYDSPKQMAWLLRDHLGYDIQSLEGKETTGREVLERLAEEGKEDVKTYLEWRKANKILTAFLPTYRELAAPDYLDRQHSHMGERRGTGGDNSNVSRRMALHPIYNSTGTRTGRLSSERPNAQQVPPQLRKLFRAREGYSFIGYDLAAIEPRLIALYTEDPVLYDIVASGTSIHDFNTTIFFEHVASCPVSEVKERFPAERKAAKEIGLALFYGAGANRIRIALQKRGYYKSKSECEGILHRYRQQFSVAFQYKKEITRAFEAGDVIPNLFGRPIRIENPEDAYMQGLNSLIQSSGSDLLLESGRRAEVEFVTKQIDATPLGFVHDYLMTEALDPHLAEADVVIRKHMTGFDLRCSLGRIPLEIEGGISKTWD